MLNNNGKDSCQSGSHFCTDVSTMFFQFEKLFHESLDSLIKNIVKIRIISEHSHVECNITILHEII